MATLFTALAPQIVATWECEGRTCGISLWLCCCSSINASQDANCGNVVTGPNEVNGLGCVSECNCTLTVKNADS